jgi:uncharacterized protein
MIVSSLAIATAPLYALNDLSPTLKPSFRGARTYRMLSDRNFHDVVLGLLFLSGVGLVWSNLALR